MPRSRRRTRSGGALGGSFACGVGVLLALAGSPSRAHAQQTAPPDGATGATPAPITPVPLAPGEPAGNRVARARAQIDELEFAQALALLRPLRTLADLPPEVAVEAALLETAAFVALNRRAEAVEACRHAVVVARLDPDVAREQAPSVRAVCQQAATEARAAAVRERGLALGAPRVVPGVVAWQPIAIEVPVAGALERLTVQGDVTIGAQTRQVSLAPAVRGGPHVALLDAALAVPGTNVRVTPLIRDAFGVLLRGAPSPEVMVPRAEAAVRFGRGSDEGALRVDGASAGRRPPLGQLVPLAPGAHELEIRGSNGVARTQIVLRRGDVAQLVLRGASATLEVFRWTTTALAITALAGGGVFALLALSNATQLATLSAQRDPITHLPTVLYDDVRGIEQARDTTQNVAIGLAVGAAVATITAVVLWTVPREPARAQARRR